MNYRFNVPLKQELPCLEYDMSLFCKTLKGKIGNYAPEYLQNYISDVKNHAKRVQKPDFPNAYRVYIVDYRLNILFAGLDTSGEIATFFSKFGKYGFENENYYYGLDEHITRPFIASNGVIKYDTASISSFSREYDFIPIEELSCASALIFDGNSFEECRLLSQLQTAILLNKFSKNNLVDYDKLFLEAEDIAENVIKIKIEY